MTRTLAMQMLKAASRPRPQRQPSQVTYQRFADGGYVSVPFQFGEPQVGAGAGMPNLAATARGMGGAAGIDSLSPQVNTGALAPSSGGLKFQDGGVVPPPAVPMRAAAASPGMDRKQNELMQVALEAEAAIRGQHPNPKLAVDRFIQIFGESAFQQFRKNVLAKREEPRMVDGPGGPKGDKIPARIDDVDEARLSTGEVVIPAKAVKNAGGGDQKRGALNLMRMSDKLEGRRPRNTLNVERAA